ncbi:MAG: hypothetical protein SGJ13_00185 [Actinomycetota bacterium]|nr:hypothetical protein [Actinomycetota bacterium]
MTNVAVSLEPETQRGLLGIAIAEDRVFAAWTRRADDRIVVAQVAPGRERVLREGPPAADLANGGHLAIDDTGPRRMVEASSSR